jgi:hypothetical protein
MEEGLAVAAYLLQAAARRLLRSRQLLRNASGHALFGECRKVADFSQTVQRGKDGAAGTCPCLVSLEDI